MDNSTIPVLDFNKPLSLINNQADQKISKNIKD